MMTPHPDTTELLDALRVFAALSGPFRPIDALRKVAGALGREEAVMADNVLVVELLSALQQDCTSQPGKDGALWVMRPGARHRLLDAGPGARADAPGIGPDETPVQQALAGSGGFAPGAIDRLIADPATPDQLHDAIVTLERAGTGAAAHDRIEALRGALNTARQDQRSDTMLQAGFFGRVKELERLATWISAPQESPPIRTMHVSGLPGIGKSFLMERVLQLARSDPAPVIVRLDFDRASLEVQDSHALFEEISRQIGDGLPRAAAELRHMRLNSAEELAALPELSKGRTAPHRLIDAMVRALAEAGRALLVVLDTLEVLRRRGETDVMTLFDRLDLLMVKGSTRGCVVSAGRGDALDPVPGRVADHLVLGGLDADAAQNLLAARGIAREHWPQILPLARGNPLLLTLAAKAFAADGFDPDAIPEGLSDMAVGGYLYRAILSRVPDHLRPVATQGLILRRINADTLTEVVAPALDLTIAPDTARSMLSELSAEHWLVEAEDGWIRHRPDVRSAFLELIYADNPQATARIDRLAATWFEDIDPLSALYHRLQATRAGHALPQVDTDLARMFTDPMLDDLPERARDAVLQAAGQRSGFGRVGTAPPRQEVAHFSQGWQPANRMAPAVAEGTRPWLRVDPSSGRLVPLFLSPQDEPDDPDPRALRDLEMMLEKGALREAGFVLANSFSSPVRADCRAGLLALAQQWQTGRWSVVRRMERHLDDFVLDSAMRDSPHLLGRVLLEIRAEFAFDALVSRLDAPGFRSDVLDVLRQSERLGMAGGALHFALLCAKSADTTPENDAGIAVARAVLHRHLARPAHEEVQIALERAERLRQRKGLKMPSPKSSTPGIDWHASALAPLNPYATILEAHVRDAQETHGAAVLGFLDALCPHLSELFEQLVPELKGAAALDNARQSLSVDVAETLTLGSLGAEWAEGYTMHHPVPDLPEVARAAERWRLATNGAWSYGGRRPDGWVSDGVIDAGSLRRARDLMGDPSAKARAHALVWVWADPAGAGVAGRQARRRLARRYAEALAATHRAHDPVEAALAALQGAGVTGVIAAPLAVLAAAGAPPEAALSPESTFTE